MPEAEGLTEEAKNSGVEIGFFKCLETFLDGFDLVIEDWEAGSEAEGSTKEDKGLGVGTESGLGIEGELGIEEGFRIKDGFGIEGRLEIEAGLGTGAGEGTKTAKEAT